MGNIIESAKNQINTTDGREALDEKIINDFLQGTMDPNLGLLKAWPLEDIKKFHDRYRRLCYYPMIDRLLFCKLMNVSKKNGYYIYSHLVGSGRPSSTRILIDQIIIESYMAIFELLCILTLLAYSNFTSKLKFLFAIFDFYGKQTLGFNQWNVFVTCFFNGLSRLYKKPFFDKISIGALAKAIFIKADVAPYDNNLEIGEVREWVDSCPEIIKLFQAYEPPFQIKEKPLIYYTFKSYPDHQADTIYRAISKYSNPKYVDVEELKEVIDMHSRKEQQATNLSPEKQQEVIKQPLIRSQTFSRKESQANLIEDSAHKNQEKSKFKIVPLLTTIASPKNSEPKDRFMSPTGNTRTLPGLVSPSGLKSPSGLNSPTNIVFSREELLKRRTEYGLKLKSVHRNVIITKGKTITKEDVNKIKYYFDTIAEGDEQLGQKHFVQHFSKFTNLQKVSASLFSFLDDKAKGFITFPELLRKLYPNLAKTEFEQLLIWSKEEENFIANKTHKRFIDEKDKANKQKLLRPMYEVPREAIKKMKYIFDLYDQGKKGFVSKDDLSKKFSSMYTPQEIDKKFEDFDKDKDGYLNLKEFIEVILPPDFYLDPAILPNH